jgi:hypothetical protein
MAAAVARTSTLCNLHHRRLLADELCFLEQALRLIIPSSSYSRMPNCCFQVRILRFTVAGQILKKTKQERAIQCLQKDKRKSCNEGAEKEIIKSFTVL